MPIGIGDLHLTDSAGKGGLSAYISNHDAMVADLVISQPLKYARKKGETDIIFYGDICENPRMSYDAQLAMLRILRTPGFNFHLIPGNHDCFDRDIGAGHSLQLLIEHRLPNVHIYTEPTQVKMKGAGWFNMLPWPHAKFNKEHMNVAHIDVEGSRTDSGRLNESKGKVHLNRSKATAVIGHIHTHQVVRNSHYSGTLYQTNFGEHPDKFFHHITFDDGWVVDSIPSRPPYRLHSVNVVSKADLRDVPASKNDLVKLILMEGCKVSASDYAHLNVVKTVPVKNEREMALAQVEEIQNGSRVEISTDEFFESWVASQNRPKSLKKAGIAYRNRILKGVAR